MRNFIIIMLIKLMLKLVYYEIIIALRRIIMQNNDIYVIMYVRQFLRHLLTLYWVNNSQLIYATIFSKIF